MIAYLILFLWLAAPAFANASPYCPQSLAQWKRWTADRATEIVSTGFSDSAIAVALDGIDRCRAALGAEPVATACVKNLERFSRAQAWEWQPGHSLGMPVDDASYYAATPYPEMLQLPAPLTEQTFLELIEHRDPASIDAALARVLAVNQEIADKNRQWRAFTYRSQHLYTPDGSSSLGRFFIYVPGDDYDRYLQFGLQDDPRNPVPNSVSIVAVQKTDPATHQPLATPQVRLIDLWRVHRNDGHIAISTRLAVTHGLENCYQCHKDAVLSITPDPSVFEKEKFGATLAFVNAHMKRYGHVAIAGLDMEADGPGLGPESSPLRTDAFIRQCSGGVVTRPERVARIRELMNCASCHDGETRGVLNYPSAWREQPLGGRTLVDQYINQHRRMPPGASDLSVDERSALYQCVRQEYYGPGNGERGLFERWLAGDECWNASSLAR